MRPLFFSLIATAAFAEAPSPSGVVVRVDAGHCVIAGCDAGTCEAACPPDAELLTIDVQEGLSGLVSVKVDGVPVLSREVRAASVTGLMAHVQVRPARWPAEVEVTLVSGKKASAPAKTRVEKAKRFLGVGGSGGKITFRAQAGPFGYD